MPTLLQIKTSLNGDDGQSNALTNTFVERWQKRHPEGRVITRDLHEQPVPHLDQERLHAFVTKREERSERQQAIVDYSDELIEELREADLVALGVPMYNFGIPSTLKAYFDHVARSGVTFQYSSSGPQGLLDDKPVYLFAARGGIYSDGPSDWQSGYLNTFLGFIGLKDTRFIYAEGLAMGSDQADKALNNAHQKIDSALAA